MIKHININRLLYLILIAGVLIALSSGSAYAGENVQSEGVQNPPCQSEEANQFDFWLGEWDLSWKDGGKGSNKISKILGGCVIQEEFNGTPTMQLKGLSTSVFDKHSKQWKQT